MNIGLIYTLEEAAGNETLLPNALNIPFGISFIASALKVAGHTVKILVLAPDTNIYEAVLGFINEFNPRMFCLTSVATQYPIISETAKTIKQIDNSIFNVVGGVHATLQPDLVIQNKFFDAMCIGEGEVAVVSLAAAVEKKIQPANIPNLWIRNSDAGTIEKNDIGLFINELDTLPYIERRLWDPWIASNPIKMQHVLMGRGCPFKCTYCSNHILADTQEGRYVRFRSPENIIGELQYLLLHYPDVDSIYFEVETFGASTKYAMNFCEKLKEFNKSLQRPVQYGINMAVTRTIGRNVELIEAMKRANFSFVNIGLESGSERVRRDVLKRPVYSNQDLIEFCKMARDRSININLFVLIGVPGETLTDFKQTVDCAKQCLPTNCMVSIFYPYPGTRLFDIAKEQKLVGDVLDTRKERRTSILCMKDFPRWRIQYEYVMFHFKVFKGQMPFYKRFLYIIRRFASMSPWFNSLYIYFVYKSRIGMVIRDKISRKQFSTS
ncbi:MAG TPA: B12-binding domain-containing radical SAM protein [Candidatus Wunengus sp. YC65]|uniref:B12-binding domain-containing radical SAM protein n=1 Tax=Candidatus Wunengus sp. YC65 TaxID=3367701 RepID=UPI0040274046